MGHQLARPVASAVVVGGRYCLAAEDGTVVALDLESGQVAWERAIDAGRAAHALAAGDGRLLVGSVDLRLLPVNGRPLLALDAGTGADLWQYATVGHSLSAAAVAGGTAYFTSSDGRLHAVDIATGHARWAVGHAPWGPGAPAAGEGIVCAGGRGDTLVAYAAGDGAELWRFSAQGWFAASLHVAGGRVYAACWDGNLYALDARSGHLLWSYKGERGEGITSPAAAAGERVLIGSRVYREVDGQQGAAYALLALRVADGSEVWRSFTGKHVFAQPAVAGDLALAGADEGVLYALDLASGDERWKRDLGGRVVAAPQIAGDFVYVGERRGTAYALRWRAAPLAPIDSPAVYQRQGEHEHAAVAYALRGDYGAAAGIYATLGQPRHAARLYERAGQPGRAAPLWEAAGELRRARDLYQ
ncbi:MAG TPA: PQQ-binding-like beta-propeller repeat protein, partial [Roseiflexaceae bacterium]